MDKNPAGDGTAFDLPFDLRANDITRHIINIDSRFRSNPDRSSTSNFYYRLQSPVKNILRIRVTSIEFPNSYLLFTERRMNVTFRIIYNQSQPQTFVVTIPDGNYTAFEMVDAINAQFNGTPGLSWVSVAFDPVTGAFTFIKNQFCIARIFMCIKNGLYFFKKDLFSSILVRIILFEIKTKFVDIH